MEGIALKNMFLLRSLTSLSTCLKVIHIHIVAGGFLGYSLGVLLALTIGGKISLAVFILGYMTVLFGDLSTHFNNDYFDVDLDRKAVRKTFGGSNTLVDNPEIRPLALTAAVFLSTSSLLAALIMVVFFGSTPFLLCLVVVMNLLGWFYSTPPVQLNARGLGEVTIALGTGFIIPAIGYVSTLGSIDSTYLFFSLPLVLYGFILSLSLELPDLEADREYGRANLVVLAGRCFTAFLVLILTIIATAFFVLFAVFDYNNLWILPILSTIPIVAGVRGYSTRSDNQARADHNSKLYVLSLFLVLIALDIYLLLPLLL
jgi:1,4-dihydroxy-2-naphthoate octaprenyltransferase